ncbi:MAG: hypothetical protein MJ141_04760 [Clostridia bacterium]|nr:hypothetical protein [Clostridia bacterium]
MNGQNSSFSPQGFGARTGKMGVKAKATFFEAAAADLFMEFSIAITGRI